MSFFTKLFASLNLSTIKKTNPTTVATTPRVTTPTATTPVQSVNVAPIPASAFADGVLDISEVYIITKWLKARHSELGPADAYMAAVMATTESGGNSRRIPTWLSRYEPAFFAKYLRPKGITDQRRATSYGILQIMLNTAIEDYNRGFKAYGMPTATSLTNPYTNLYFGMAHQVYIRRSLAAKGIALTEKNIVMSYNGGIGANNSMTQNHYNKYAANKAVVNSAIA